MTLIKSISGIRGTIGGKPGNSLTPEDVIKFTVAYGTWVKRNKKSNDKPLVVVGRDARISGQMVGNLVTGALMGVGCDILNIDLATTPTTEMAVIKENADGGIILTASHNPRQWNALKLLNEKGEFLTAADGAEVLEIAESGNIEYADIDGIGKMRCGDFTDYHIDEILKLDLVDVDLIKKANFKVAIDCVNSVGGTIIPKLLRALGVSDVIELYCEPNGEFPHNPEPLPEHLTELSGVVKKEGAHVGFVVDPDVDRLAVINEDGSMFGEEYTLVAVADYVLANTKGATVSNLSSSLALKDVTEAHGCEYSTAAVGEVNVVAQMKATNAVIGGEGNGGVIYPALHSGRDALVGIALFLTYLAQKGKKCSELKEEYPKYEISKNKLNLPENIDVDAVLSNVKDHFIAEGKEVNTIDGVKVIFEKEWVHLRKSNTEPIIRIYSESASAEKATELAESMKATIGKFM